MNIVGNIISGQVTGETAKALSERFGKIVQLKESVSINRTDTSVSKSGQLDAAVPASKIAALSSGEFVGMVADNPDEKIKLKVFNCQILSNNGIAEKPTEGITGICPQEVSSKMIAENYNKIKTDTQELIELEIERILNTPEMHHHRP